MKWNAEVAEDAEKTQANQLQVVDDSEDPILHVFDIEVQQQTRFLLFQP
jgi:hypothetical protein